MASDKTIVVMLNDDLARFREAWADAFSCHEVVEGVLNLVSLVQATHWYSYEEIALLRALLLSKRSRECRWGKS